MRLRSVRIRHYRLHRDCAVVFDPRFTVITGRNQSGKSTLAEAMHRVLFLPVKTGGELLKGMHSDPFVAPPEVELTFEAGGQPWVLSKRFAGSRGSTTLQDSSGRSLQGEEAEERLAQLIGTAAVARTRGAADQLKERWGHLWVWQGSAGNNPLALSAHGYDHDRLVERLQAGAALGVQSPLDLAVIDDIQQRWSRVYTAGGANRAPQVKKGSDLQLAQAAVAAAGHALQSIRDGMAQQAEAEQIFQAAEVQLQAISQERPQLLLQRQALEQQLGRSRELEAALAAEQPQLQQAEQQRQLLEHDRRQLDQLQQQVMALQTAQVPDQQHLDLLRQRLPELEAARTHAEKELQSRREAYKAAMAAANAIEHQQKRLRQLQELQRLQDQLDAQARLQSRCTELERELTPLPALTAKDVETLRRLETAVREARVRAEAHAAGIDVIRAACPVRIDGVELVAGSRHLLSAPASLQVGDDVELRLIPGDGTSAVEARELLQAAERRYQAELSRWTVASVDEAATAERRRSDLLAERQRLLQQRGEGLESSVHERLQQLKAGLEAQPQREPADADLDGDALERRLRELEQTLDQARKHRDGLEDRGRQQRALVDRCSAELDAQTRSIAGQELALRDRDNQLLAARTRVNALLERHGSAEALSASLVAILQRCSELHTRLASVQAELKTLGADTLPARDNALKARMATLDAQERDARDARIRAQSCLQGDGQVDLQAELEQKQAELESRQEDQDRLEKEAAMLSLLRRLLDEEQNAMAMQYTAPLTDRIGRYLAQVFPQTPQVSLSYDARCGFQELQWRQGHGAIFGFDVLSTGAREQFAAALRVTMAEVLAEAYDGTLPVLFDDAFANSDPERQAGVHRMLQQAAEQGLQVILLTCDSERSRGIEGAECVSLVS